MEIGTMHTGNTTKAKVVSNGCCEKASTSKKTMVMGSLVSEASEVPIMVRSDWVSLLTREMRSPVFDWLKKASGKPWRCAKTFVRKLATARVEAQFTR